MNIEIGATQVFFSLVLTEDEREQLTTETMGLAEYQRRAEASGLEAGPPFPLIQQLIAELTGDAK